MWDDECTGIRLSNTSDIQSDYPLSRITFDKLKCFACVQQEEILWIYHFESEKMGFLLWMDELGEDAVGCPVDEYVCGGFK